MPAYRSSAEAEIRDAVVARIREHRPSARIIHEINVSTYGPNRIDVLAVDRAEIIAVEIKSAKDKLDRLPAQVKAMQGCAHHSIAAIHEKFLVEQTSNEYAGHYQRDGQFFIKKEPPESRGSKLWVYPQMRRAPTNAYWDDFEKWNFPDPNGGVALPHGALNLLWRDELYELCSVLRVSATRRSNMSEMIAALRWHCTGKELTKAICLALRVRTCTEADAPIYDNAPAGEVERKGKVTA